MDKPEDEPVDWHDLFTEDKQVEVFTGISEPCREGKHDECPGHEYEGNLIFCICPCHRFPPDAPRAQQRFPGDGL